jgi:hypothetical protein
MLCRLLAHASVRFATQFAMHASRFGSTAKHCARHPAVQDRRFAPHPDCAAVRAGPATPKAEVAEATSRSRPAEWRIGYGRM